MISYHGELLLVASGAFQRKQRRIVPDGPLPLAVEVVSHDVYEVQVLGYLRYVVAGGYGLERSWYGCGKQKTRLATALGLTYKSEVG